MRKHTSLTKQAATNARMTMHNLLLVTLALTQCMQKLEETGIDEAEAGAGRHSLTPPAQ
jgi:hypothetical protein